MHLFECTLLTETWSTTFHMAYISLVSCELNDSFSLVLFSQIRTFFSVLHFYCYESDISLFLYLLVSESSDILFSE